MSIPGAAQQDEKIHFQITVRDYNGNLLSNQDLGVRVRVLNSDMNKVFEEVHQLQSSATGIVSINIGSGSSQSVWFWWPAKADRSWVAPGSKPGRRT